MPQSTTAEDQLILPILPQVRAPHGPRQPGSLRVDPSPAGTHDAWAELFTSLPFLVPEATISCLEAPSKSVAIRALVSSLTASGAVPSGELESLVESIVRREELGTTGIGRGVAIPHTKHPAVQHVVGAFACAPRGIDFSSVDGRPVHLIFLLLSPVGESRSHLLALEAISRRVSDCGYHHWRNPSRHGED